MSANSAFANCQWIVGITIHVRARTCVFREQDLIAVEYVAGECGFEQNVTLAEKTSHLVSPDTRENRSAEQSDDKEIRFSKGQPKRAASCEYKCAAQ